MTEEKLRLSPPLRSHRGSVQGADTRCSGGEVCVCVLGGGHVTVPPFAPPRVRGGCGACERAGVRVRRLRTGDTFGPHHETASGARSGGGRGQGGGGILCG